MMGLSTAEEFVLRDRLFLWQRTSVEHILDLLSDFCDVPFVIEKEVQSIIRIDFIIDIVRDLLENRA